MTSPQPSAWAAAGDRGLAGLRRSVSPPWAAAAWAPSPGLLDQERGRLGGGLAFSQVCCVGDDLAVAHHDEPVRERGDARVVRHHDDRALPLGGHLLEQAGDLVGGLAVEVAGGLVGQDELGLGHERAGDRDALLLPAGQLVGPAPQALAEADLLEPARAPSRPPRPDPRRRA